jgi:hypothetical protein
MLWAHELGGQDTNQGERQLKDELAGNARVPNPAPDGDLDAARA